MWVSVHDLGNRSTLIAFCISHKLMCLQVEVCDDSGGRCARDISNECHGFVHDSDIPTVQQVNNIMWNDFVAS